jgi:hypothetical protein
MHHGEKRKECCNFDQHDEWRLRLYQKQQIFFMLFFLFIFQTSFFKPQSYDQRK